MSAAQLDTDIQTLRAYHASDINELRLIGVPKGGFAAKRRAQLLARCAMVRTKIVNRKRYDA